MGRRSKACRSLVLFTSALCAITVFLAGCRGEVNERKLADEFDIYSVGKGHTQILLKVTLPEPTEDRTFDVLLVGKDYMISCKMRDTKTGQEYASPLVSEQIITLNNAIRQNLSGATLDQLVKDKLVWERWESNTWQKHEFPIDIGNDEHVVTVFNRVIELSSLPTYDVKPGDTLRSIAEEVLGDSNRWKEIREVNPELVEDGSNLNHAFDIRVPRE